MIGEHATAVQFALGMLPDKDTLSAMSNLAQEVDATLSRLDSSTATKFERLIRDAVALVHSSVGSRPASKVLDKAYFDSVIGAFAGLDFDRPPQGELPDTKPW